MQEFGPWVVLRQTAFKQHLEKLWFKKKLKDQLTYVMLSLYREETKTSRASILPVS